jgi:hypothetical protein
VVVTTYKVVGNATFILMKMPAQPIKIAKE